MEKQDKTIVCVDCGEEFTFTVRDQLFYEQMGFNNEPRRCKKCRDERKAARAKREENNNNRDNRDNRDNRENRDNEDRD